MPERGPVNLTAARPKRARDSKVDYNTMRPHSKLGEKIPAEIARQAVWGYAPTQLVISSNINHERKRLYLRMVTIRGVCHCQAPRLASEDAVIGFDKHDATFVFTLLSGFTRMLKRLVSKCET